MVGGVPIVRVARYVDSYDHIVALLGSTRAIYLLTSYRGPIRVYSNFFRSLLGYFRAFTYVLLCHISLPLSRGHVAGRLVSRGRHGQVARRVVLGLLVCFYLPI